jgi:hypothetical protein
MSSSFYRCCFCSGIVINLKKKLNKVLNQQLKKANAKNQPSNKPRYISKAERAVAAGREAEAGTV